MLTRALALSRSLARRARATRSPQVSRPDDCSNPCDAVADRTQDALGLIDSLLPGSGRHATPPRPPPPPSFSLTGVNCRPHSRRRHFWPMFNVSAIGPLKIKSSPKNHERLRNPVTLSSIHHRRPLRRKTQQSVSVPPASLCKPSFHSALFASVTLYLHTR